MVMIRSVIHAYTESSCYVKIVAWAKSAVSGQHVIRVWPFRICAQCYSKIYDEKGDEMYCRPCQAYELGIEVEELATSEEESGEDDEEGAGISTFDEKMDDKEEEEEEVQRISREEMEKHKDFVNDNSDDDVTDIHFSRIRNTEDIAEEIQAIQDQYTIKGRLSDDDDAGDDDSGDHLER